MTNFGSALKTAAQGTSLASAVRKVEETETAQNWERDFKSLERLAGRLPVYNGKDDFLAMINSKENSAVYQRAVELAKKLAQDLRESKVNKNLVNRKYPKKLHGYCKYLRIA